MNYLKDEQYYIDLYDLITIRECLHWEENIIKRDLPPYKGKKIHEKLQPPIKTLLTDLPLYYIKGENYVHKAERIREWMEKDKEKQDKYDNASEPLNIFCPSCGKNMHTTLKELYDFMNEPLRVLFFFECSTCNKRKGIFDNGEEFKSREKLCDKCKYSLETSIEKKGKKTIWATKCTNCDFKEEEEDDFEEWKKQRDIELKKDEELLSKFRTKYCLSETEGQEYVSQKILMEHLNKTMEESKRKEADPAYKKVKQLRKMSVVELERLLSKGLEKQKYTKLTFDKPEIGQFVIIPFTVQDADSSRKEYDSTHELQKLVKNTLEKTNWRLMSEGTSYRLGYVYGRLKGYERDEDMAKLFRAK
ncbi:MAG: hypothetical protein QG570_380 [Patescibacteria group bacterium]|jgi:hypothetical protein|nr:hypothetical protein [Patescibacteria group bacterium]